MTPLSLIADTTANSGSNDNPLITLVVMIGAFAILIGWRFLSQRIKTNMPALTNRCPSCGAVNARRVHLGERVASGAAGGILFSKKARAQFQCQTCKYYW